MSHHFAHFHATNCNPETVLHFTAKSLLFEKISKHIHNHLPLHVHWLCSFCADTHTGNLLRRATQVRLEHDLGVCQPDITLLDRKNVPVVVIEVIVTHKPEEATITFCRQRKITLIKYRIKDGTELETIQNAEDLHPASVDRCTRPKCQQCHHPMKQNCMVIVFATCKRCKHILKVPFVLIGRSGDSIGFRGPEEFTDLDLKFAKEKDIRLPTFNRKSRDQEYLACSGCNKSLGDHFLTDYLFNQEAEREEYPMEYHCDRCSSEGNGKWVNGQHYQT